MNYFGTRLKYLREQDNLTQLDLSRSLGISKSAISMYERGKRQPDFETIEAISDFFNVKMSTFFPDGEIATVPADGSLSQQDIDRLMRSITDRDTLIHIMESALKRQRELGDK